MDKIRWGLIALLASICLAGCTKRQVDSYNDSFFTFEDEQGQRRFSFVLKVNSSRRSTGGNVTELSRQPGANTTGKRKINSAPVIEGETKEDARISIRFRMEEEAHQRLALRLEASDKCSEDSQIETEEYDNYQYHIRGLCAADTQESN